MPPVPHIIIVMGVAGSGKTTIGRALAEATGWSYLEADEFHPAANIEKMSRGTPLDDADRAPWLAAIRNRIDACLAARQPAVIACSALKDAYRRALGGGTEGIAFAYLRADPALVISRVASRAGHYMKAGMVESQFATLEPPVDALVLEASQPPALIVAAIRRHFGI